MNIVEMKVDDLIPYESNPRNNDNAVGPVAESIREFGFKIPIVIDSNNVIVAGHTRLKAAQKLGMQTVPCIIADDLTDDQIKAFRLVDNKVSEFAEWDFDKLKFETRSLETIDLSVFGFIEATPINNELLENYFDDVEMDEMGGKEEKHKSIKCPHCGEVFEI